MKHFCVAAMKIALLGIWLVATSSLLRADDAQVVTGIKQQQLFARMHLDWDTAASIKHSIGPSGMQYCMRTDDGDTRLKLLLAVHPRVEDSSATVVRLLRSVPGSATPPDATFSDIGEMRYKLGNDESGTIAFARRNVSVILSWLGSEPRALALARSIDQALIGDRDIAPMGAFAEIPAIESLGLAATAARPATPELGRTVGSWKKINPTFRGLGNPADLRVQILGKHFQSHTTSEGRSREGPVPLVPDTLENAIARTGPKSRLLANDEDGRFLLKIRSDTPPGVHKVMMVAGTADNVVVTRTEEITITAP